MTTPNLETVLARVQKMHAKAESARAIGSLAEAETFAAAVARLLSAHKLSMSDVELAAQDVVDPMGETLHDYTGKGGTARQKWAVALASAVARAHYCRTYTSPRTAGVCFIGRASDRELAVHVFATLYRAALMLSSEQSKGQGRAYRPAWLVGFSLAIAARYREQATERAGHMALVRADAEAEKALRATPGMRFRGLGLTARSGDGLTDGKAAGRSVSLRAPARVESSTGPRMLSAGGAR